MRELVWVLSGCLCAAAELPVRHVVLYKNGVGYFERSGTLAAGGSARLDFKTSEMNDVLKSLVIVEKGGGGVAATDLFGGCTSQSHYGGGNPKYFRANAGRRPGDDL